MAISSSLSSEFSVYAEKLAKAPNDYKVKTATLNLLMQMKALAANGDAMAQYRLAKAYPRHSDHYKTWMQAAANQGLTNAMFDLTVLCDELGTDAGLREAAQNVVKIFASNDSYMKAEAKAFIEQNRPLGKEVARQMNNATLATSTAGFFAPQRPTAVEQVNLQSSETCKF